MKLFRRRPAPNRRHRSPNPDVALHDDRNDCYEYILAAFTAEADLRKSRDFDVWVTAERQAVVDAANRWATANGYQPTATAEWVERIEHHAVGYVDYMRKLSRYTADLVVYGIEQPRT